MYKVITLCFLALICASTSSSPRRLFFKAIDNELPLIQANNAGVGSVPVNNNTFGGFKVQIYVDYNTPGATYQPVDMQLALYSNESIFTVGCSNYDSFNCSNYTSCSEHSDVPVNKTFPYFQILGYNLSIDASVDVATWDVGAASLATTCDTNSTSSAYGKGTQGFVGMGIPLDSALLFSIYLGKDDSNSKMLFSVNSDYIDKSFGNNVFGTDENWRTDGVDVITISGFNYQPTVLTRAMFDLNTDYISLPVAAFNEITSYLDDCGLHCVMSKGKKPTCSYEGGSAKNLPDIIIYISTTPMKIPAEIYIENYNTSNPGDSLILNLRPISSDSEQPISAYVTPAYENYIILGSNFMKYYYTVFDGRGVNAITIYKAKLPSPPSPPSPPSGPNYAMIYSLIAVGVIAAIATGVYCYRKKTQAGRVPLAESEADN